MIGFCAGLCWRMPRACARVIGCFAPCVVEDCTCICVVSCFAHQWLGLIYLHSISVFHSFSFSLFLSLMPLACGFIHFTSLRSAKGGCDCPCSFDGLVFFGFFFFSLSLTYACVVCPCALKSAPLSPSSLLLSRLSCFLCSLFLITDRQGCCLLWGFCCLLAQGVLSV